MSHNSLASHSICDLQCEYQSESVDQQAHERHWVEVHWWRQEGYPFRFKNVFQR